MNIRDRLAEATEGWELRGMPNNPHGPNEGWVWENPALSYASGELNIHRGSSLCYCAGSLVDAWAKEKGISQEAHCAEDWKTIGRLYLLINLEAGRSAGGIFAGRRMYNKADRPTIETATKKVLASLEE